MKVIEYARVCGRKTVLVILSYSEDNLQIAEGEAYNGEYTIKEVADDGVC